MAKRRPAASRVSSKTPGIRKILAPTDFSPGAEPALRWAASLGNIYRAKVIILHALDLNLAALAGLEPGWAAVSAVDELARQARAEARAQMASLERRYPSARTMIREGSPRLVILDTAAKERANLIVMGTHGRSGLSRVFFGSVAEHVVRHSHIPVLTVRQNEPAKR